MNDLERPYLLVLLLAIPLAWWLRRRLRGRGARVPFAFSLWGGKGFSYSSPLSAALLAASNLALALAFAALAIALAGPVLTRRQVLLDSTGGQLLFVLDESPSMAAADSGGTTRFEAARGVIAGFAEERGGDSLALVGYGTEAALLVPPTPRRDRFLERLGSLKPGGLGEGTAIGMGLLVAANHLSRPGSGARAVILLTDGENNAGSVAPETAARMLRSKGARLYVIGFGEKGASSLSFDDPLSGRTYKGSYLSGYDEASLRALAEAAGGFFYPAADADSLLGALAAIGEREKREILARTEIERDYRFRDFAVAALVLAALARFLRRGILGAAS